MSLIMVMRDGSYVVDGRTYTQRAQAEAAVRESLEECLRLQWTQAPMDQTRAMATRGWERVQKAHRGILWVFRRCLCLEDM
jgi:hypothetical protein